EIGALNNQERALLLAIPMMDDITQASLFFLLRCEICRRYLDNQIEIKPGDLYFRKDFMLAVEKSEKFEKIFAVKK
ncbi:hypothetical protein ACFL2B_02855, partial [Patescibacteria group bacterium]